MLRRELFNPFPGDCRNCGNDTKAAPLYGGTASAPELANQLTPFTIIQTNPNDGVTIGSAQTISVRFDNPINASTLPATIEVDNALAPVPVNWIPNPTPSGPNEYITDAVPGYGSGSNVTVDFTGTTSDDGGPLTGDAIIQFSVA